MTPRSCEDCDWSDGTLRDGDLVLECHLNPPVTMPPAPEVPEVPDDYADHGGDILIEAFAEPHRYPVVDSTDWCSYFITPPKENL